MRILRNILLLVVLGLTTSFAPNKIDEQYSLTINVEELQNSEGVVQYTLYNRDGSIPDEHFEKFYKQGKAEIINNTSSITFDHLPKGTYAINILHDENEDGKIEKGWILPIEGIGFSNLKSINPLNKPSFKKAKFEINTNKTIQVKIIYM